MELLNELGILQIIAAATGLGTAAFGIVETMKSRSWVGEAGFEKIENLLGPLLTEAMRMAYGNGYLEMLKAQYKSNQQELRRSLRQGVRVGLTEKTAEEIAGYIGVIADHELTAFKSAARKAIHSQPVKAEDDDPTHDDWDLTDQERILLARYELAADGRIEGALAVAETSYACTARFWAWIIGIVISIVVGISLALNPEKVKDASRWFEKVEWSKIYLSVLIGFLAAPIAPIAKDLSSAVKTLQDIWKK